MRVALFSGNYNYLREGANQALNLLVGYLERDAGCDVRIYSPVTDTPAFEPAGTLVPVPSIALPVRSEFQLARGLPQAIRRDLARFAPDVIHVATPDILGTRAQTFALQNRIPLVASLHTRFETYLDHYKLGWLRPAVEWHIRRFYRRCDHVLAPTPGLVAEMKRLRGDDAASLWSRGVDRDRFSPEHRSLDWRRAHGIDDDRVVVLFFGRLVFEKGVETFVRVVRQLEARHRVTPLVVGAGPAPPGVSARPAGRLTRPLDGAARPRAGARADIMLSPSTTEAFGNVVLEAMASGVPVVSADTPSAAALLVDGETGVLCPADDLASYVAALCLLVEDAGLRQLMGRHARLASEAFSWDAASEAVAAAYRALTPAQNSQSQSFG